jgi:hypothetical protein
VNRREFARISALSLAATQLPPAGSAQPQRKIGYAPVGLGQISSIFMRAVANSSTTKITGLVSGHPEKAARFADMYGVPRSSIYNYEDFDRIRENKDIDATYIGLPNSMHKEFTVRSAQAGKHVLCEKPMAISSAECREMIAACRKAKVKLMIAYRIHYDPTHLRAVDLIKQGRIGEIQFCEGNFGSYFQANQWRLTRAMGGGGPLMDMGIYPLLYRDRACPLCSAYQHHGSPEWPFQGHRGVTFMDDGDVVRCSRELRDQLHHAASGIHQGDRQPRQRAGDDCLQL